MGRIRILDEATINKIAAGEVVERPASVVKELVENALDAGATRIHVCLEGGGMQLVAVTDDGSGMSAVDAPLAVQRHATSKITRAGDLESIRTLGFRGEALSSIGAVSRLDLTTRENGAVGGYRLVVRGGELIERTPVACAPGTSVEVADLFANVPARRKHLKGQTTELDRCLRVLIGLALACPEVAITATHNGRQLLSTPGDGRFIDVIRALYGGGFAAQLVRVDAHEAEVTVGGYVGLPQLHRATRSHQYFLVNGRPVTGYPLREAVEEAFRDLLALHRYPVAFLHLELAAGEVDVNVHPAKLRVRIRDEGLVRRVVRDAVRGALLRGGPMPRLHLEEEAASYDPHPAATAPAPLPQVPAPWPQALPLDGGASGRAGAVPAAPREWAEARVVGQVLQTYIVAEGRGSLYLVDQHAAHERVNYERLLARMLGGRPCGRPLAAPAAVELSRPQMEVWRACREGIAAAGFVAEPFGDDAVLLREAPSLWAGASFEQAFVDLLDGIASARAERVNGHEEMARLTVKACRSSVRANDALSLPEMRQLLQDLSLTENPYSCPHGRPTLVEIDLGELRRRFGRA